MDLVQKKITINLIENLDYTLTYLGNNLLDHMINEIIDLRINAKLFYHD